MSNWFGIRDIDLFIILVVLSMVAVAQFYRGRKVNLKLIEFTARRLEELYKPVDKNYWWIGVYVGFRALYKLLRGVLDRVEVTFILLPRHSIFYFPISLLTTRFDRIFLVYWYNKRIPREAHLVQKGYYRRGVKRVIDMKGLRMDKRVIRGKEYYAIYNDHTLVMRLVDFLKNVEKIDLVKHIAFVPKNNTLYVAAKYDPEYLDDLVEKTLKLALDYAVVLEKTKR